LGEIAVGAVFVSVATTLPEVFVSIIAVVSGDDEIAVGNAVGSMIFNMAVCVAVYLFADSQTVKRKSMRLFAPCRAVPEKCNQKPGF
jgi:cation:H+ antiporter